MYRRARISSPCVKKTGNAHYFQLPVPKCFKLKCLTFSIKHSDNFNLKSQQHYTIKGENKSTTQTLKHEIQTRNARNFHLNIPIMHIFFQI